MQIIYATLGANIFYFLSAPMMSMVMDANPFDRKALEVRRARQLSIWGRPSLWIASRERGSRPECLLPHRFRSRRIGPWVPFRWVNLVTGRSQST